MIFTPYGAFEGYRCDEDLAYPLTVLIFFWFYIILTAWVRSMKAKLQRGECEIGRIRDLGCMYCMRTCETKNEYIESTNT
jgi:hypothetical protein